MKLEQSPGHEEWPGELSMDKHSQKRERKKKNDRQLIPLGYWFDRLDSVLINFLIKVRVYEPENCMKFPDLESSGPHQTPMPAMEPTLPFPLHAPSLYTTSHSLSSSERDRFLALETTREGSQLLVDASAFEASDGSTPRAKNLASSKVLNFLYLAFGKPLTCSSQSDLGENKTFN